MEGKINRDYLKSYSASYTNNILDTAFKDGPYLQGQDLTKLCSPDQVNYNLLKNIFLQWEAEVSKLQSPYFDYSATAVQSALKTFMDVLSKHIKLDKGSLRPLLQQAVEETLYLIFQPLYFFENFLWPPEITTLSLNKLAKLKRFVKINQAFLQEINRNWEDQGKEQIELSEFQTALESMRSSFEDKWEPQGSYIDALSKVVSLQPDSIWKPREDPDASTNNGMANINDKFAKKVVSLNDTMQKDQTTLADQHLNKKVENIKSSLSLNQKFMFVNELFAGDSKEFITIMDQIEDCRSYEEAIRILDNNSSQRAQWNMESYAVKELIDLVSRRF